MARLSVARVDPWSVMKLSFLLSLALGIVLVVATFLVWTALDSMGVFSSASSTLKELTSGESGGAFDLMDYIALRRVMTLAGMLALVNIVLMTALSTLCAFLYNITAALVGGLQVTLREES